MRALMLAFLALVLAFAAVEGTTLLQSQPAPAVMKGESVTEAGARLQSDQTVPASSRESFATMILGPLTIAALCYVFARKRI